MMYEANPSEAEKEFITLEESLDRVAAPVVPVAAVAAGAGGGDVAAAGETEEVDDGPERETPESFEYPFEE